MLMYTLFTDNMWQIRRMLLATKVVVWDPVGPGATV